MKLVLQVGWEPRACLLLSLPLVWSYPQLQSGFSGSKSHVYANITVHHFGISHHVSSIILCAPLLVSLVSLRCSLYSCFSSVCCRLPAVVSRILSFTCYTLVTSLFALSLACHHQPHLVVLTCWHRPSLCALLLVRRRSHICWSLIIYSLLYAIVRLLSPTTLTFAHSLYTCHCAPSFASVLPYTFVAHLYPHLRAPLVAFHGQPCVYTSIFTCLVWHQSLLPRYNCEMSDPEEIVSAHCHRGVIKDQLLIWRKSSKTSKGRSGDPAILAPSKQLQKNLESADTDFKQQHFTLVKFIETPDDLAKDQTVLDKFAEIIDDISAHIDQLIGTSTAAPGLVPRQVANKHLQWLKSSLRSDKVRDDARRCLHCSIMWEAVVRA